LAPSTYSFKDVAGSFTHPIAGVFIFAGQIGSGQFIVKNAAERRADDVAADGTVMISYISNETGSVDIEVQQNSPLHDFLVNWANIVFVAAENGNLSTFASAAVAINSTLDGSAHVLTGVSPTKIPDKTYAAQGQKLTWTLMAAQVTTVAV
jgi:Protein of unknown function (DUF3277)